jgi:S-adenosylmethionine/arginine decarboxylase-like enzyme
MDKNQQKDFIVHKAWGMSCTVDIKQCNPEKIRSAAVIQDYIIQLCKLIDMVRFGDCQIVNFGSGDKAGFTMVQLIETSCITGHFSNDLNAAFIDIFSCKPFDRDAVVHFTKQFFDAKDAYSTALYRK